MKRALITIYAMSDSDLDDEELLRSINASTRQGKQSQVLRQTANPEPHAAELQATEPQVSTCDVICLSSDSDSAAVPRVNAWTDAPCVMSSEPSAPIRGLEDNDKKSEDDDHLTGSRPSASTRGPQDDDDNSDDDEHLIGSRPLKSSKLGAASCKDTRSNKQANTSQPTAQERRRAAQAQARAEKAAQKERDKQAKKQAAERKKTEKEAERLQKQSEKEKQRTLSGKKKHEMITLCMDQRLTSSDLGAKILDTFLNPPQESSIKYHKRMEDLLLPNSIQWRRHQPSTTPQVDASETEDVAYVLLPLTAMQFIELVHENREPLETLIHQARQVHPGKTLCLMVVGLYREVRKREVVRGHVDMALAWLCTHATGVRHRLPIDNFEAADHVWRLTRELAAVPFLEDLSYLSIFGNRNKHAKAIQAHVSEPLQEAEEENMDGSQANANVGARGPRRAVNVRETWLRMLVMVPGCAEADALAIANVYPSMNHLCSAYEDSRRTEREKEYLLKELYRMPGFGTAVGASTQRKLGPKLSERIYKIFRRDAIGFEALV